MSNRGMEMSHEEINELKVPRKGKFPDKEVIGGSHDGATFAVELQHKVDTDEWIAAFLDEEDQPVGELMVTRGTPKEAFFAVVDRHTILNGGVDTNLVRYHRPSWESMFRDDGFPKPMS